MAKRPKLWRIGSEMRRWCAVLEEEVSTWPDVSTKPMFGMVAFYRGKHIFGAVPRTRAAETETSLLVKLPGVYDRRLRSASGPGAVWVSLEIGSESDIGDALAWFAQAYEKARSC